MNVPFIVTPACKTYRTVAVYGVVFEEEQSG